MNYEELIDYLSTFLNFRLFEINNTEITPSSVVLFLFMMLAFAVFSKIFRRFVLQTIFNRTSIDKGTQFTFKRTTHYVIMIIGAIISFQFIGIDLSGLAVIFGLLSVGIGFGLQNVTSNFVAGLILLFERPIQIGDRITVGATEGDVQAINMRSTMIRTLNNISIIVPNSEFVSNQVVNWSHGDTRIRMELPVGVSYNSDLPKVLKALKEAADDHPDVLKNPKPDVLFKEFGDSSWNLTLLVWTTQIQKHHFIRSQINGAIVEKFRKYDIEIPFPQRDLHLRSPESISLKQ